MRKTIAAWATIVALLFAFVRVRDAGWGRLPKPTGPYAVGSTLRTLRHAGEGAESAFTVQIWYPAVAGSGARAPYAYGLALPLRDRLLTFFLRTDAVVNAPIVASRRPVILYVPGLGGNRASNTALAQELASHGYIVVAFGDTRPNGSFDFSSRSAARSSLVWGNDKVDAQARDISGAIDALVKLDDDRSDRFANRLDLDRLGIVGFSFGGAVAAEVAARDPRVAAAVNLDGWMFGNSLKSGVARPFLLMSSDPMDESLLHDVPRPVVDEATFDRYNTALSFAGLQRHGGYVVSISDFDHNNFTDAALLPSLRRRGMGRIEPSRGYRIVADYVRSFFDRYVEGEATSILDARVSIDATVDVRRFLHPPNRLIEH